MKSIRKGARWGKIIPLSIISILGFSTSASAQCQQVAGKYASSVILPRLAFTEKDPRPMIVLQRGCDITASFADQAGTTTFRITGNVRDETATIKMVRTDAQGCKTDMFGNILFAALAGGLRLKVTGTSGTCGFSPDYSREVTWLQEDDSNRIKHTSPATKKGGR